MVLAIVPTLGTDSIPATLSSSLTSTATGAAIASFSSLLAQAELPLSGTPGIPASATPTQSQLSALENNSVIPASPQSDASLSEAKTTDSKTADLKGTDLKSTDQKNPDLKNADLKTTALNTSDAPSRATSDKPAPAPPATTVQSALSQALSGTAASKNFTLSTLVLPSNTVLTGETTSIPDSGTKLIADTKSSDAKSFETKTADSPARGNALTQTSTSTHSTASETVPAPVAQPVLPQTLPGIQQRPQQRPQPSRISRPLSSPPARPRFRRRAAKRRHRARQKIQPPARSTQAPRNPSWTMPSQPIPPPAAMP